MAVTIDVTIEGTKEARDKLRRSEIAIDDFSAELQTAGEFLVNFTEDDVFETEGQIIGHPWKPLSDKYQARKQNTFPGRGTLERSGTMRSSFTFKSGATNLTVFNTTDYFKYHQSSAPRTTKLPRRVMLHLDDARTEKVADILADGLRSRIRRIWP